MLQYTGHPLYDVGVATLAAFASKRNPTLLTEDDLQNAADYMAEEYVQQPLKSFLTVAFTTNAWFFQDQYNPDKEGLSEDQRAQRKQTRDHFAACHLASWCPGQPVSDSESDVFTGARAAAVSMTKQLPPGRGARTQVPLLVGDEYINFSPYGEPGLPLSGTTVLVFHALPLGCAKCGGRLLAVHSDNAEIMYHFASHFLADNRRSIQLAHLADKSGSSKMPENARSQRTLLVETLLTADEMQKQAGEDEAPFSVTAYHLTNSGQGADLAIYHLPLQIVGFLRFMNRAENRDEWYRIVNRAWEVAPKPGGRGKKAAAEVFVPRRNWLYEDLFNLPDGARAFIRTYFLRTAVRYARGDSDPRVSYSLREEAALVSWRITASFLRGVMGMEKERIEQIRDLGDRLAAYVASENDRKFFRAFYSEQRYYGNLRNALIRANTEAVRSGSDPLITLDTYLEVFEESDVLERADWRFARDLVLIRMVECLHKSGWLHQHSEVLPETSPEEESSDESGTAAEAE